MSSTNENFFPTIGSLVANQPITDGQADTEEEGSGMQEIESLCMKCGEQGKTRLLLTSIPFFREVIVMSFRCDHCNNKNNEIQSAGEIRPEGTLYTARILARSDLNRQIVRSPTCAVLIPEYELTLPASRGQLTTVEGLIRDVVADLDGDQVLRRIQNPDAYEKIQVLIDRLKVILGDSSDEEEGEGAVVPAAEKDLPMPAFTLKLDDPAGNSFIEFIDSMADPKWNMRTYKRTHAQNVQIGIAVDEDRSEAPAGQTLETVSEDSTAPADANEEIFVFHGFCSSCSSPLDTLMKKVVIPYFKDILIMSTNCDVCGYRDNEVKSGSAISEQGKRITLKVEDRDDLSRDILKSETSGLSIPEIDLVLERGTLGGRFTTLEGILDQVYEELSDKVFTGDSSTKDEDGANAFETFLKNLKAVKNAERPFTLIIDDPLANSYLQNIYAPDPDPNMTIESYDRTWQQNEELGLNDMKVEGYEEDHAKEQAELKAAEEKEKMVSIAE